MMKGGVEVTRLRPVASARQGRQKISVKERSGFHGVDVSRGKTKEEKLKMETKIAAKNITSYNGFVTRKDRETLHGNKGAVIWFTGLSASGKSTIAHHLEKLLHDLDCSTYVSDGDNGRHCLCGDRSFSQEDRTENIRRIGEMTKLFVDAGILAIAAFISPYRKDRQMVRDLVGKNRFLEIYVNCPIEVCAKRDQKGIYAKAEAGMIKEFTGISSPYEPPENPALIILSNLFDPIEAAEKILTILRDNKII